MIGTWWGSHSSCQFDLSPILGQLTADLSRWANLYPELIYFNWSKWCLKRPIPCELHLLNPYLAHPSVWVNGSQIPKFTAIALKRAPDWFLYFTGRNRQRFTTGQSPSSCLDTNGMRRWATVSKQILSKTGHEARILTICISWFWAQRS
jgi:hypothetical protein